MDQSCHATRQERDAVVVAEGGGTGCSTGRTGNFSGPPPMTFLVRLPCIDVETGKTTSTGTGSKNRKVDSHLFYNF